MAGASLNSSKKIRFSFFAFLTGLSVSSITYLALNAGRTDLSSTGLYVFLALFAILALISWLACGIPFAIKVPLESRLLRPRYLPLTAIGFAVAGYTLACVGFCLITQEFDPRMWIVAVAFGYEIFLIYALPISLIAIPLYGYLLRRATMRLSMSLE